MAKVGKPIDENQIIKDGTIDAIIQDFKNLSATIDKTDENFKSFAKSVKEFKFPKGSGEFKQLIADTKELETVFKSQITTQREKIKIQQEEERLNKMKLQTENQQIKNNQQINKQVKEQTPEWQKLLDRKRQLTAQIKEEVLLNGQLSPKLKALRSEYASVKGTVDSVNESLGNHQHKVGQYERAIGGLRGALGQLGLAFGGFTLAREAGATLLDFENNVASFRTIVSDLSDKDFEKYKSQIKSVAKETNASSVDIAKSFEGIAGLNAEFAETAEGLGKVSEATITLSKASKDDLETSTDNLVSIMNQFNLGAEEADRAINVLAAGQAVGAASISQLAESYKNVGSVASSANLNIEQSTGALETLGKFSLFGAEAGTKLRGVILQLQKANLGYESGQFNLNDALEEYNAKSVKMTSAKEKDALASKVFGAENITAGKILSANIPLIEKYTKGVTGTSEAQKASAINSDTLSQKWQELKNSLVNIVTSSSEAEGGVNLIKDALGALASNLPMIISLVTKLGVTWLAYKAIMLGMDFGKRAKEFINFTTAVVKGEKSMKDAGDSAKKFGSALKSIGTGLAIGIFLELAMALYDIASGASQAREDLARLDQQLAISNKRATGKVSDIQDKANQRLAEYNEMLKDGQITQKQYNILISQSNKQKEDELRKNRKLVNERKEGYKALIEEVKELQATIDEGDVIPANLATTRLIEIGKQIGATTDVFGMATANSKDVLAQLTANVRGANEAYSIYGTELRSIENATKDFTDKTTETDQAIVKSKNIFIDYTKSIRDLNTEMIEGSDDLMTDYLRNVEENQNELQDALAKVAEDRKKLEEDARNSRNTDGKERTILNAKIIKEEEYIHALRLSHQKQQQELWDAYIAKRVEDLKERFAQEKQLQKEALEDQQKFYDYKVETGALTERVNELQLYNAEYNRIINDQTLSEEKKNKKIEELNLEHQKKMLEIQIKYVRQQIDIQTTMAQRFKTELGETSEEYENSRKRMLELEEQLQNLLSQQAQNVEKKSGLKESLKKVADYFSGLISAIGDKMNEMFDNMAKSQNRVIENSQKMIDYLKQAAIQGNLQASQSILAEEKKIEESQRRIEKIEKNRQRVQFITSILGSYSQKVANGDKNALLSTLSESAVLSALLRALPSFGVGADRLSNDGQNIDGKGGFLAVNHPDERILTAGQNKQIGFDYSNNEIVNVMKAFNNGLLMPATKMPLAVQNNANYEPILREIKDGFSQINNYNMSVTELFGIIEVMVTKSKGNSKVTDFKKYKA